MSDILKKLIAERRWLDVIYYARRQMWFDGLRFLRRYSKGVEVIESEFYRLFGRPAIPYDSKRASQYQGVIAQYIRALKPNGVKMLIDDLRLAAKSFEPRSLMWFLFGKDGQSGRWEMLVINYKHAEAMAEKKAYREAAEDTPLPASLDLPSMGEITPEWVHELAEIWERLSISSRRTFNYKKIRELKSEMARIEARLHNAGYNTKGERIAKK